MKRIKWVQVRNKILLATVAVVLTLFVVMVAAEIYLRYRSTDDVFHSYTSELHTHDGRKVSFVGSLKLSLAPFTVYRNLPSQHTSAFTINSHGLRGPEGVEQDPAPKIVFLGGSAAFGYGARTDQETIPYLMEQSIKSHRVLNAGVIGFLSGQELTHLVTQVIDYRPTIVVAYDGWNDLFDSIYSPQRSANELGFNSNFFEYENHLILSFQNSLSRLIEAIGTKSRVYAGFLQAFREYQYRKTLSDQYAADPSGIRNKALLDSIVENYVGNVRKMSRFSQASGAEFIVVFQPELGQKLYRTSEEEDLLRKAGGINRYHDEFPALYREFLAKAKQQLTQDRVQWIDVNESPDYQKNTDSVFIDVVHTNRRGNEIVADIISRRLQLLIKSTAAAKPGLQVPSLK
jgi:hypothetical protein